MKYKYNIKNLDCANCAKKIEETLNKQLLWKQIYQTHLTMLKI